MQEALSPLTLAFVAALLASLLAKFWLAARQIRHVARHRAAVPPDFDGIVTLTAHQRAADYTIAKTRFGLLATAFGSALLLGWTLLGGLDALNTAVRDAVLPAWGPMAYQLALLGAFMLIASLLELPLEAWGTFRIEQRFGFNRMTGRLFVSDFLKSLGVMAVLGPPLAALVLWLMASAGSWWWLWAWAACAAYMLLMMVVIPIVVMPLYNRFTPLDDPGLLQRVQALMQRCGFKARGLFVMDGSKRSAHINAFFTGLGSSKRVILFDTLLDKLSHAQLEAVLAHELGHFRHRHLLKRMSGMFAVTLIGFALLGWLAGHLWFYADLGVEPNLGAPNDALALLLLMLVAPPFMYFVSPWMSRLSRRHEFEADAYACANASGADLKAALLRLYEDNASTLTPDPVYVSFYYSHPPAAQRLAAMSLHTA
ncbi:M48 family metallopeptidase [Eleftheria terrae]|uniref:M48 family metallopeptidase n=1 Tax=Eleftheria terrae TaxID=1597781 RepID=UPI00263BD52C|nr:M48 family metallopeptidase [Eleftheria terrae]WKB54153.1 M48 family metallopeptidase [Eleftheria terrae]